MKKSLLALTLSTLAERIPSELKITPAPIHQIRQHPSLRHGKSGVAVGKRAAKKKKGRLKK